MKGKFGRMFWQAYDCIASCNLVFGLSTVTSHNSFICLTGLQELQNVLTSRANVNPKIEIPPALNKKKKLERDLWLTKSQIWWWSFVNRNTKGTAIQLHCMCSSKGKTSLCSTASVPSLYSKIRSVFIITKTFTDWKSQTNFLHLTQQHCSF